MTTDCFCSNPHVKHLVFSWVFSGIRSLESWMGRPTWREGEAGVCPKFPLAGRKNGCGSRGVNVLTRQLRNVCWETFWGLVSWKWKKNTSFFDSQLKNDGSSWISKVGQVGQQAYVWFQLFSIFLMVFLGNSIGWVQPPPWNDIYQQIHSSRIPVLLSLHKVYILIYFPQIQIDSQQIMFPKSL